MEVAQFGGGCSTSCTRKPDHVITAEAMVWKLPEMNVYVGKKRVKWGIVSFIPSYIMILVKYNEILDVSCTVDEISGLAKVSRCAETSTGSNQAQRIVKMSAGVVVEFGPWGSRLYSGFSVVESDIYCRIWCHMFVKTVRTVRLRYAFTQIVMIRSHFHCRNTVEILILQWDHSKLSTYKSPHTSSIWGVTWNRWSHSSIYNKNDANNIFSGRYKIGFEIKNEIEGQGQSSPKFSGILRVLRCIIGPNLEILSWTVGEWWHGQGQNMAFFYFEVKFDLEGHCQSPPKQ